MFGEPISPTLRVGQPSIGARQCNFDLTDQSHQITGRRFREQAATPEKQGLKRVREYYKKQYDAWVKERDAADKKAKDG